MGSKFDDCKPAPEIVCVNGQKKFLCQLTGRLSDYRAGIPGRNNSLSGTFCCWNAVLSYLQLNLNAPGVSGILKTHIKQVEERAYKNNSVKAIASLPDPDELDYLGGTVSWEEYTDGIELVVSGCQTIKEALEKIETKKELRKQKETVLHKHGYTYEVTENSEGKAVLQLMKDEDVTSLLNETFSGEHMMPTVVIPVKSDACAGFENYILYHNAHSTKPINQTASQIAQIFLQNTQTEIRGTAILFAGKKHVGDVKTSAFIKAVFGPDTEEEAQENGGGQKEVGLPAVNKRKQPTKRSKKTSSAETVDALKDMTI